MLLLYNKYVFSAMKIKEP